MTAPGGDKKGGAAFATTDARLRALYSIMQSIENKLGGGEGVEGLYGSIKRSGMDKVLQCMQRECGLDKDSVLVDVGAGLGRPLMHALLEPGIAGARGVEIDRIKCDKAAAFLVQAIAELRRRGVAGAEALVPPPIDCSAIETVASLDPCTHAYSFWEGVPADGKAAFGRLFAASGTLRSVAVVQRAIRTCPVAYMADLGFGRLQLAGSFSVSMSGSGRSFTAYVFNKAGLPLPAPAAAVADQAAVQSVQTPVQAGEAAAAISTGAVAAAAAEGDGETAQSRLALPCHAPAPAAGMVGPKPGRGRRQRKPSAKQQEAEECAAQMAAAAGEGRVALPGPRAQRAMTRSAAQQVPALALAALAPATQRSPRRQQAGAAASAAAASPQQAPPAPAARQTRSSPRLAAAAVAPATRGAAAGSLSSPRGGVQKRASSAAKSSGSPGRRSPCKLGIVQAVVPDGKQQLPDNTCVGKGGGRKQGPSVGSGGRLLQAARAVKSGLADGVAKLRPTRAAAAACRGLQA